MNRLTLTAVSVLAAAAVLAPISSLPSAQAAPGKDWTTVETFHRAKQQACKVSTSEGNAWRIFNRVDARNLEAGRVRAKLEAFGPDSAVRTWESGWVRHGNISAVGAITVPKDMWGLAVAIGRVDNVNARDVPFSEIGRC